MQSLFYGVMAFSGDFECVTNNGVGNPPQPPIDITTVMISFMELQCTSTDYVYENTTKSCYYRGSPRIYIINFK